MQYYDDDCYDSDNDDDFCGLVQERDRQLVIEKALEKGLTTVLVPFCRFGVVCHWPEHLVYWRWRDPSSALVRLAKMDLTEHELSYIQSKVRPYFVMRKDITSEERRSLSQGVLPERLSYSYFSVLDAITPSDCPGGRIQFLNSLSDMDLSNIEMTNILYCEAQIVMFNRSRKVIPRCQVDFGSQGSALHDDFSHPDPLFGKGQSCKEEFVKIHPSHLAYTDVEPELINHVAVSNLRVSRVIKADDIVQDVDEMNSPMVSHNAIPAIWSDYPGLSVFRTNRVTYVVALDGETVELEGENQSDACAVVTDWILARRPSLRFLFLEDPPPEPGYDDSSDEEDTSDLSYVPDVCLTQIANLTFSGSVVTYNRMRCLPNYWTDRFKPLGCNLYHSSYCPCDVPLPYSSYFSRLEIGLCLVASGIPEDIVKLFIYALRMNVQPVNPVVRARDMVGYHDMKHKAPNCTNSLPIPFFLFQSDKNKGLIKLRCPSYLVVYTEKECTVRLTHGSPCFRTPLDQRLVVSLTEVLGSDPVYQPHVRGKFKGAKQVLRVPGFPHRSKFFRWFITVFTKDEIVGWMEVHLSHSSAVRYRGPGKQVRLATWADFDCPYRYSRNFASPGNSSNYKVLEPGDRELDW